MKNQYADIPKNQSMLMSLRELSKAFALMGLLVFFGERYNFLYLATEEFGNLNLFHKVINNNTVIFNLFVYVYPKN